ncbi:MAG: hypothetical protein AAF696_28620 [Bacteroidota bacterium]
MKKITVNSQRLIGLISFLLIMLAFSMAKAQVKTIWETDSLFFAPECVVYDSVNKCIYVSNYNDKGGFRKKEDMLYDECISKIDMNGKLQEMKWIDNLMGPTGLAIYNQKLFIVERDGLSIVDIAQRKVQGKIIIEGAKFLNDIAIDKDGRAYISDTDNNCIYKIEQGKSSIWFSGDILDRPNGLYIDNDKLLVGLSGKANLLSLSLSDKKIEAIATGVSDYIDGINKLNNQYLLSWKSELYIVGDNNAKSVLFESEKDFLADFDFIKKDKLVIIPALLTNKVIALKLED